jgi:hypothetical protein
VRYFFHIRGLEGRTDDQEGSELPDMEAARSEARTCARELAIEELKRGQPVADRCIEITDGDAVLESLMVRDVVRGH